MTRSDPQPTAGDESEPDERDRPVRVSADRSVEELSAIRRLLFGILIILIIVALYFAREVLLPIVLGILLSLTLRPIVRTLSRWRVPAPVSSILLITSLGLSTFAGAYLMSGTVSQWVDEAPSIQYRLERRIDEISEGFEKVREASEKMEELGEKEQEPGKPERVVVEEEGSYLAMGVSSLAAAGSSIIAAMMLSLFLLASGDLFYSKLVSSFDRFGDKKRALKIVYDVERRISRYLFTVSVINLGLGLAVGVAMYLVGLPYPYIWGALAFALNYLPFVGLAVGATLCTVYALVSFDSTAYAFVAPALYVGLGALEGNVITPLIVGRRLELNTVSVLIAVVFWTWLWGVAGALMAVPILVLVKVVCDNVDRFSSFSHFLGPEDAVPAVWEQTRPEKSKVES